MTKQLKTHWTRRIPTDAPLSATAAKTIPGKRTTGGKAIHKGWRVYWNKKEQMLQLRHDQYAVIELEGPGWTWGRFITLLATLKLIKIDGTVRYTIHEWIDLQH